VGYRINRQWQLTGSVGHEWQDYDAYTSQRDDDTWDAGVVWTPSARTSLNLGYGDRYFGNAPRVNFTHRSKRTTFTATYDRTLTTSRDIRAQQRDVGVQNPFGLPYDPVTGRPLPASNNQTFLNSGSIIDERFETSLSVQGNRTTVTLSGSHSNQTREDNSEDGTFDDLYLNLSRSLSRTLSIYGGTTWEQDEDDNGATADTMRYYLGLSKEVGPRTSLGFNYSYSDRNSQTPDDSYKENRVYLNVTYNLL